LPKIESIGDVLKRKTASAGGIDMLFGAMANSLGYETRIALSGDRSEMFFKPDMTNESFVHLAAVAVKVGDDWRLFNPGTKFAPFGTLLWYEEDVWSLLVGDAKSSWEQIPPSDATKTVSRRTGKFKLLEDGTLEGAAAIELNGQEALTYRMENYDKSDSKREEDFK